MRRAAISSRRLAVIAGFWTVILLLPGLAVAHPLGNFTINTYSGLRVAAADVTVDHILDMAEIPAFQERTAMDADGDDVVSDAESTAYAERVCGETAALLEVTTNGEVVPLRLTELGLTFPPGQGGLTTLRLVCIYRATLDDPIVATTGFAFADRTYPDRIGWREVVVEGDGVTIRDSTAGDSSISDRLTVYPEELLVRPLSQTSASFNAIPGGAALPAFTVADANPIGNAAVDDDAAAPAAVVPGGIGELGREISAIIQTPDLTPFFVVLSLAIATGLGALHAASPGHGKTIMAAYLVGNRGTARHALGLGLTVTVSHTIGVLGLALLTLFASSVLPAERVYPVLGAVSGLIIVGIGLAMLVSYLRDRHGAGHTHADTADHGDSTAMGGEHNHGPIRHSHLPPEGRPLRWRNLVALGLAGGLVPSASALILLLGSVSLGRPAYGVVLIVFFGLGMAAVLVSVGMLLVKARTLLERLPSLRRFSRLAQRLPLVAAAVVLIVGVVITVEAVGQLAVAS